jgi:hypothetical protein
VEVVVGLVVVVEPLLVLVVVGVLMAVVGLDVVVVVVSLAVVIVLSVLIRTCANILRTNLRYQSHRCTTACLGFWKRGSICQNDMQVMVHFCVMDFH